MTKGRRYTFRGKWLSVDGGESRVELVDESMRESFATMSTELLAKAGILLGDRFSLEIATGGWTPDIEITPIPRKRLSAESIEQIRKDIAEELVGL